MTQVTILKNAKSGSTQLKSAQELIPRKKALKLRVDAPLTVRQVFVGALLARLLMNSVYQISRLSLREMNATQMTATTSDHLQNHVVKHLETSGKKL